jgi:TRAP-type C4-dicarboxylate transport system permease small subunit
MEHRESGISTLAKVSNGINSVCEAALFATIVLMTCVTILQIVCRIWLKALTWSEELTCFLLVFASFFGMCVAFRRGANISVNFLRDNIPIKARRYALITIECVGIAFFVITGWYGGVLCLSERTQMASSMPISISWMYLVFPTTSAITIIHLCARIDELFRIPGQEGKVQ